MRRQAHIREKVVQQLESEFEPAYGWRFDDPELLRPFVTTGTLPSAAQRARERVRQLRRGDSARQYARESPSGKTRRALSSMS